MFELRHPWLVLAPLLAGLIVMLLRARGGGALSFAAVSRNRRFYVGPFARGGLRTVTVLALAFVLAGPHTLRSGAGRPEEGVAIVVALDVSESMRDESLGVSTRIDVALDELQRFIDGREGDVVGLVTFAGEVLSRVPPVLDRAPLRAALQTVRREKPEDGTALGTAIGVATNRLRAVEARSRVVVAITDGESNAGVLDPITAAGAAAALGVRVYTVGVGGEGASTLSRVAEATGGRHYSVEDREGLDRAYQEIDALEPSRFESMAPPVEIPRHAQLLWLAGLLMVAEGGVRASRGGGLP